MAEDLNFLQQKAREWALKVVELHKMAVPPAMKPAKDALIASARTIKTAIEKAAGTQSYLAPLNQLGALPLIVAGGAAITWAVAAVTKWSLDYSKFKTEVAQFNNMVSSGMTPQQAANVMQQSKGFPFSTMLKVGIPLLAVGGIIVWLSARKRGNNGN